jgi:hypothetical protein
MKVISCGMMISHPKNLSVLMFWKSGPNNPAMRPCFLVLEYIEMQGKVQGEKEVKNQENNG